ncbi:MAG: BTAD domain-containing putative transcriptional regulator [Gemmatimonadaceae bacterium]
MGGAATQRRMLALLALLTRADAGGLSRDKLIALLWPDADESRARHSLTQALYTARRAFGDEVLVLNGQNVQLDPAVLSSDVQAFDACLQQRDFQGAVQLYTGPFLDTLALPDAGDFERWCSVERDKLRRQAGDALEQLSAAAETAGDFERAAHWRRQLAALEPFDARIALKLMNALVATGDRASALRHAQVHTALLREELELDADPDIAEFSERIRSEHVPVPALGRPLDPAITEVVTTLPAPAPTTPAHSPVLAVPARRRLPFVLAGGILLVAVVALLILRPWREHDDAVGASSRVVVAPFRVAGADPALAYLRDGMVELLSSRLADDSASRSVDAGAVLRRWRSAGLAAAQDIARDTALVLARRLGAERVVVGSVVGNATRMVITATMLETPSGKVAGQASAAGPPDSLVIIIDRLAARLLVSVADEEETLTHSPARSLPALKHFLAGQSAYRRDDYAAALTSYAAALKNDSSFALAALYAATTADALHLSREFQDAVAIAWRARDELGERDLALLDALAGPAYPAPSSRATLVASWQRLVDLAPQSSDAWYQLAMRLLEDGATAGVTDARTRAVAALQRAVAINDRHPRANALLATLTASVAPADSIDDASRWLAAITAGDSAALGHLRGRLGELDASALRTIALATQHDSPASADARPTLAQLRTKAHTQAERANAALGAHSLAVILQRDDDAIEATEQLRRAMPGSDGWLRLRVLDALYAGGDSAAAVSAYRALAKGKAETPFARPVTSSGALANACVVAQWQLSAGDSSSVRATVDALRAAPDAMPLAAAATPVACAGLLDAWVAVVARRPDAAARVRHADSLAYTPQATGDAAQYANILIARLFLTLRDSSAAAAAVARTPYLSAWPRYQRSAHALGAALK